jgi:hypothetical protein
MVRRDLDKESEVDLVGETSEIPTQASALVCGVSWCEHPDLNLAIGCNSDSVRTR